VVKKGYIYLLWDGEDAYKIGATKNHPSERIKNLNSGNPNKIVLIDYFECEKYFKVEKMLHKKYSQNKTDGNNEWRYLSREQVYSFKSDCEILCDTLTYIYNNNEFL